MARSSTGRTLGRGAGAVAFAALMMVAVSSTSFAGGEPPDTEPDSSIPDSTSSTSSTTTTTTTTLPMVAEVGIGANRENDATWVTVMPTLPPPPTTTTTTIPFVDPTILPANSGSGRRAVYSKSAQRVWLVEDDGSVTRTYRVSGRLTWNQPTPNNPDNVVEPQFTFYGPGTVPAFYRVASRSSSTCNLKKPYLCWKYMVRFTKGGDDGDNIGFHQIPVDTRTGNPVQTLGQLGQPLSGGCVRQAPVDAEFMWNWGWVGTKVVVLA